MPKRPILSRIRLYDVLNDGTMFDLDFNLVQTSIGAMLEVVPLAFQVGRGPSANMQDRDAYDMMNFNDRRLYPRVKLYTQLGAGGDVQSILFNN